MKKSMLILSLILLCGCSTINSDKDKQEFIVNSKTKEIFVLPLNDMEFCDKLSKLSGKSLDKLYEYGIYATKEYNQCAKKHKELTEWILRNNS